MKIIVFGASLSGKTTITGLLRENHDFNISEIDEELTNLNGGTFPEDTKRKHLVLVPKVIKKILDQKNILFFCNTDYFSDQDIINAKELGFKIFQLDVSLDELQRRNKYRRENKGYEDMSQWLKGMSEYQDHIFKKGFVDEKINANLPIQEVVQDLVNLLKNTN